MIPDKSDNRWKEIIYGNISHTFSSFALQMMVNRVSRQYKEGRLDIEDGVNELHELCQKYAMATRKDLKTIFNLND